MDLVEPAYLHFDGMTWPHPDDPSGVEWRLRYGEPSKSDLMVAASYVAAYRQLLADSQRARNKKISALRRCREGVMESRWACQLHRDETLPIGGPF